MDWFTHCIAAFRRTMLEIENHRIHLRSFDAGYVDPLCWTGFGRDHCPGKGIGNVSTLVDTPAQTATGRERVTMIGAIHNILVAFPKTHRQLHPNHGNTVLTATGEYPD
jgi:hypothetical protein